MKIAHISDIHFFNSTFPLKDLFSKKCIGKLNAFFRRKDFFITDHLDRFLASLIKEEVNTLIISGDFTTTSDIVEFELAKEFIQMVLDRDIKVCFVPGNHDVYTKKDFQTKPIQMLPLSKGEKLDSWNLLLLDTTTVNPPFIANGKFTKDQEEKVKSFLKKSTNIIIVNHFPLDDPNPKHELIRGASLKKHLLNHNGSIIYLHGHTHKTGYHKQGENLHIFNSSEVTVKNKYKYQIIDLKGAEFSHKEVEYFK